MFMRVHPKGHKWMDLGVGEPSQHNNLIHVCNFPVLVYAYVCFVHLKVLSCYIGT